jgi:SAM-dependent methyltransferase
LSVKRYTTHTPTDWSIENKLIPPPSLNYNSAPHTSLAEYQRQFGAPFISSFLPRCLELVENECKTLTDFPRILDLGCGFGPMAFAIATITQDFSRTHNLASAASAGINYLGIDIREDAILFLENAYADHRDFLFHLHNASKTTDYLGDFHLDIDDRFRTIASVEANHHTKLNSSGSECRYELPIEFFADLQWSSSFFTHLTPQGVQAALEFIKQHIGQGGLTINTWLIVDEASIEAMKFGKADRVLNIDKNEFLTYSDENPLVCTAYKIEYIEKYYANAGLEIVRIERGCWRGPSVNNSFNHYQDIVIARPI